MPCHIKKCSQRIITSLMIVTLQIVIGTVFFLIFSTELHDMYSSMFFPYKYSE